MASAAVGQDVVELSNGAKLRGKVVASSADEVTVEVIVNGKSFSRKYAAAQIKSMTVGGVVQPMIAATGALQRTRTKADVEKMIAEAAKTPPSWLATTVLEFPDTLDLDWPQPPPQPWNNAKNVGQFIWDRVNPNPGQWRNGVKLMHHIMDVKKDDPRIVRQAMLALGGMYHHLMSDYARAAYWLQRAGIDRNPESAEPHAGIQLADCYFHLGNKVMAMAQLKAMRRLPLSAIKLMGDFGETEYALRLANQFAAPNTAVTCYLYAGDVCRVAGKLDEAEEYYRKALAAADNDGRNNDHSKRDRQRAEASLAAIEFYRLDPKQLADGTYVAESLGYEDQVEVTVAVRSGRITDVRVSQHREKQFYSSISDTPPRIIARQSVNHVDTVTGATITSEAIINATAKALAKGKK